MQCVSPGSVSGLCGHVPGVSVVLDAGVLNLVFISSSPGLSGSAVSDAGVLNLVFISSSLGLSGSAVSDAGVH